VTAVIETNRLFLHCFQTNVIIKACIANRLVDKKNAIEQGYRMSVIIDEHVTD